MTATPELTGSRCLCRTCDRTFRNLAAFDAHGPHRDGCGDPTAAGLVEQGGIWATPEGHAQQEAMTRQLATARSRFRGGTQGDERAGALPGVAPALPAPSESSHTPRTETTR